METNKKKSLLKIWKTFESWSIIVISMALSLQFLVSSFVDAQTPGDEEEEVSVSIPVSSELQDGVITLVGNGDFKDGIALDDKKLQVQGYDQSNSWTATEEDFLILRDSSAIDGFRMMMSVKNLDEDGEDQDVDATEDPAESENDLVERTTPNAEESVGLVNEEESGFYIPAQELMVYTESQESGDEISRNTSEEPLKAVDDEAANVNIKSDNSCSDSQRTDLYELAPEIENDSDPLTLSASGKEFLIGNTKCEVEAEVRVGRIVVNIPEGTPAGRYSATLSFVIVDGSE